MGFAFVTIPRFPRKHWTCESNPISVIGFVGVTYPVMVCAKSDRPSLTHVASPGFAYDSRRCWYSCAKTLSYRNGRAGALVQRFELGSWFGEAPVRCSQSNPSIVMMLRSKKLFSWDEKNPAIYEFPWVLLRS